MSPTPIWFLYEGDTDRVFYRKLIRHLYPDNDIGLECAKILSPDGQAGGKTIVLKCFDKYKSTNSLLTSFKGKVTTVGFLVDRDIDGVLRKLKRSPHVIYTQGYSFENYVYQHNKLLDHLEVILDIDANHPILNVGNNILKDACALWVEWAAFCLTARTQCPSITNYGIATSLIHNADGTLNNSDLILHLRRIASAMVISETYAVSLHQASQLTISKAIKNNKYNIYFNGKWFPWLLSQYVKSTGSCNCKCDKSIADKLTTSLLCNLSITNNTARYYKKSIDTLRSFQILS